MLSSLGGRTSDVAVVVTHALRARSFKTAVVPLVAMFGSFLKYGDEYMTLIIIIIINYSDI